MKMKRNRLAIMRERSNAFRLNRAQVLPTSIAASTKIRWLINFAILTKSIYVFFAIPNILVEGMRWSISKTSTQWSKIEHKS